MMSAQKIVSASAVVIGMNALLENSTNSEDTSLDEEISEYDENTDMADSKFPEIEEDFVDSVVTTFDKSSDYYDESTSW